MEVHVKDESRTPGQWAFYEFDSDTPAKMVPRTESCYSCHEQHAAVATTFVQFYPTLLAIAKQKGTLSPSYTKEQAARSKQLRGSASTPGIERLDERPAIRCRKLHEGDGLDAGDVEALAAADIFAGHQVVGSDHVRLRFGEAGAIALIRVARQRCLLAPDQPSKLIVVGFAAVGAGQTVGSLFGLFVEKISLFHAGDAHSIASQKYSA